MRHFNSIRLHVDYELAFSVYLWLKPVDVLELLQLFLFDNLRQAFLPMLNHQLILIARFLDRKRLIHTVLFQYPLVKTQWRFLALLRLHEMHVLHGKDVDFQIIKGGVSDALARTLNRTVDFADQTDLGAVTVLMLIDLGSADGSPNFHGLRVQHRVLLRKVNVVQLLQNLQKRAQIDDVAIGPLLTATYLLKRLLNSTNDPLRENHVLLVQILLRFLY